MKFKHKLLSAGISVALGAMPMTAFAEFVNVSLGTAEVGVLQAATRSLGGQTVSFTESGSNAVGGGTMVFTLGSCADFELVTVAATNIGVDAGTITEGKLIITVTDDAIEPGALYLSGIEIDTSACAVGTEIQISLDSSTNITGNANFTPITMATVVDPDVTIANVAGLVPKTKGGSTIDIRDIVITENAGGAIADDAANDNEIIMTLPTGWTFDSPPATDSPTIGFTDDTSVNTTTTVDVTSASTTIDTVTLGGSTDMSVTAPDTIALGEYSANIIVMLSDGTTTTESVVIAEIADAGIQTAVVDNTLDVFTIDPVPLTIEELPTVFVNRALLSMPDIMIVENFADNLVTDDVLTLTLPIGVTFAVDPSTILYNLTTVTLANEPINLRSASFLIDNSSAVDIQGGFLIDGIQVSIAETFDESNITAELSGTVNGTAFTSISVTLAHILQNYTETVADETVALPVVGIGSTDQTIRPFTIRELAVGALVEFVEADPATLTLTLPEGCSWTPGVQAQTPVNISVSYDTLNAAGNIATFTIDTMSDTTPGTITFAGDMAINIAPSFEPGPINVTIGGTAGAAVESVHVATAVSNTTTSVSNIPALKTDQLDQEIGDIVITELFNGGLMEPTGTSFLPGCMTFVITSTMSNSVVWSNNDDDISINVTVEGSSEDPITMNGWNIQRLNSGYANNDSLILSAWNDELFATGVFDDAVIETLTITGLKVNVAAQAPDNMVNVDIRNTCNGLVTFTLDSPNTTTETSEDYPPGPLGITETREIVASVGDIAALEASATSVSVVVEETEEVVITGGLGDLSITTESDNAIATASLADGVLSITGILTGNTSVTISDSAALVQTVIVSITVSEEGVVVLPSLPDCIITNKNETCTAHFAGGATSDAGNSYTNNFELNDVIDVTVEITPDATEVGQNAEIYVVAYLSGMPYMRTSDAANPGTWIEWDQTIENIQSAYNTDLTETTTVVVVEGLTALHGLFDVYVGYKVGDNIVYTGPFHFTVNP